MFSKFLESNTTYPIQLQDFPTWHKGIKYFGFWAIEVSSSTCEHKIKSYQNHLSSFLHPNYLRQAHITLVASGLLSDEYFSEDLLKRQIEKLEISDIKQFSLKLKGWNSFSTCPYLAIEDSFSNLDSVRKVLNNTSEEVDAADYTPHVTLGFYNEEYKSLEIVKNISDFSLPDIEFKVEKIVFAQYETKDIQGPYEVLHRIKLSK
ncbi:2'-5' RNA ligase family protein [Poseidonibacter lekithochrous]|uniref:2'-5' RNA ligase family protein n=1 Tax=Poseidonibacter TaxID=2321187 RepID=UPI001C08BF79|nr:MULTISPECIES: 2'-5' RNA ligase family protein [Poseidonibacter]MBU3016083.1 2'-5' RNA ligase family protein [Poseidonibacter lekithochrous]MDO6829382.1 2'-5' RNA ligase family protein [Poseidonibacter sp. 1_MG-2023]